MKRIAGFTLIELMVTIGMAAILATIAVPAYNTLVNGNRVSGAVNDLAASFALARSEAITRGEQVAVCPKTPGKTSCFNNGWSYGWIVFADPNGNGTFDDGTKNLIRVHGKVGRDMFTSTSGMNNYVAFNRMGFAQPTFQNANNAPLTIVVCPADKRDANARAVVLALSGDISTAARKPNGNPFSC